MNEKDEIYQSLDKLPKEVLEEMIIYLKSLEIDTEKSINLSTNLQTILEEDKEVLEKLAQ